MISPTKFRTELISIRDKVSSLTNKEDNPENEHQTRRMVIDPILDSLGWTEDKRKLYHEEFFITGQENNNFLDYLCIEEGSGIPKIVVEAKKWTIGEPAIQKDHPKCGIKIEIAILLELLEIRENKCNPSILTKTWFAFLKQVSEYTHAVDEYFNCPPEKIILTNGRWFIVLLDPKSILTKGKDIPDGSIRYFNEPYNIDECNDLFSLINEHANCDKWDEYISASNLNNYLNPTNISKTYRGLFSINTPEIEPFGVKPVLRICPTLLLETQSGLVHRVVSEDYVDLIAAAQDDEPDINLHLDEITAKQDEFFAEIKTNFGEVPLPSDISGFDGFKSHKRTKRSNDYAYGEKAKVTWVMDHNRGNAFIIALGTAYHFIDKNNDFDSCSFHSHDKCSAASSLMHNLSDERINKRLFKNQDIHYCGHKEVRKPKIEFCVIRDIEEGLCCQKCIFKNDCWSIDLDKLPCESEQ